MSTAAPVNRIIPISTVDGPGCRTAVFLQGCNLSCAYCHNPETQNLCTGCGLCADHCPSGALERRPDGGVVWNPGRCTGCDACIRLCPSLASPKVRTMTPEEVMAAVEDNLPFIRGITVSVGECTLYPEFLTGLFTLARARGLTCLADSNGTVPLAPLSGLMGVCDGVMLDVKAWDPDVHKALTGSGNETVKENLAFLSRCGKLEELRIVCVPGAVDVEAVLEGAARVLGDRTPSARLKLIAFRPNGVRGAFADRAVPTAEQMSAYETAARRMGFREILLR